MLRNKNFSKKRILAIGQTPPPYGGQAMIIKELVEADYKDIQIFHIRMSFSKEMSSMGKFEFFKLILLLEVIVKIYLYKFKYRINTLYYPPSGPNRYPVYRDIIILILTRWLFRETIFQFFAGGVSEYFLSANSIEKYFMKKVYFYPDITLRPSHFSPDDGIIFKSKKDIILPWGVEDNFRACKRKEHSETANILFIGVLKESKGILVLLKACKILLGKDINFKLTVLGAHSSHEMESRINDFIISSGLEDMVCFDGVKTGNDYYRYYENADIFCFPSYFESENLPVVLIDACKFGLPVVSTEWRSIPEIIVNGKNGFLVKIKDAKLVAEKLEELIFDVEKRLSMGNESRKLFIEKFEIETFIKKMNLILNNNRNKESKLIE